MKNLKFIIAIFAISLSTIFSMNASEKNNINNNELRTEIVSILGNNFSIDLQKSGTANISFMINNKNEIVIISVDSDITELNALIKGRLNYKKIDIKGTKKGEIYKMPLRINVK